MILRRSKLRSSTSSRNKTRVGWALTLLFIVLGAGVFRTPAILLLTAIVGAAPLVSVLASRFLGRGLRVSRQMPACGIVGETVRARLVVSNVGPFPSLLVHGRGAAPGALVDEDSSWLSRESDDLVIPVLWPGARVEFEVAWKLTRRGVWRVPGAGAGAFDPLGLWTRFSARSPASEFLCLPRVLRLHRVSFTGASGGAEPRGAAQVADAAEPHGVRPHRPGEGLRRVNWKATARSGMLHVVEWEEESGADLVVLIDAQRLHSKAHESAIDDALESGIVAAASLSAYALEHGQRVRLFWWEDAPGAPRLVRVDGASRGALGRVLEALARLQFCADAGATLANLTSRVEREVGREHAILALGHPHSAWNAFDDSPASRRSGLAFEIESLNAHASTPTRALPVNVRRVKREDSLRQILERGW